MFSPNLMFYIFSIALVICALMVVVSQHPVFSLLFLVASFLSASVLLFLLECEFLALLFIVIYVGAIAVLFLFAIMMLESKLSNLSRNMMKYVPVGFLFGFFLLIPLLSQIWSQYDQNVYSDSFYFNNYQNWYDLIDSTSDIEVYGQVLYSYFVLQFLVAGLILLLVLIGVVHLTNNFNSPQKTEQSIFKQISRDSTFFFKQ
jgi:NADH-quinone oxidoreductase subunit J